MKLVIRVCLAVVGIALIAVGSGGLAMSAITAKPAQADNAGGYSMEVRIAASQVALPTRSKSVWASTTFPAPYQSAQWNIDYDQTLIDIDSIADREKIPAPAACTSKNDNGTRFLVGCVGLGPNPDVLGQRVDDHGILHRGRHGELHTHTLCPANVSDGTSAQTIHTHNDSIECGGAGPTDTPVPVVAFRSRSTRAIPTRGPQDGDADAERDTRRGRGDARARPAAVPPPRLPRSRALESDGPGIAPPDTGSGDGTCRGATPFALVYGALIALGGIALASGPVFRTARELASGQNRRGPSVHGVDAQGCSLRGCGARHAAGGRRLRAGGGHTGRIQHDARGR